MALKIEPQVLLNLLELKEVVLETNREDKVIPEKVFLGLLHKQRGALLFAHGKEELKRLHERIHRQGERDADWKGISLRIYSKKDGQKFSLLDEHGKSFTAEELSQNAEKIVEVTLSLLNEKSQKLAFSPGSIEERVLEDLSFVSEFFTKEIEKHPAWMGNISRGEAESFLRKSPRGTFVLRRGDKATEAMMRNFCVSYRHTFPFFILTYSESHGKISEKLILEWNGWFIYNDEPRFETYPGEKFDDIDSLLNSIEGLGVPYQMEGSI
jgi:hypothetical protein